MTSILTSKPVGMPTPLMSDDALYEVVNGQRVELPPMSIYAVWIGSRLQARLAPFAEAKKLGTVALEDFTNCVFGHGYKTPRPRPMPAPLELRRPNAFRRISRLMR